MSILDRLFGTTPVEIPTGAHDQATAFDQFTSGEIRSELSCCNSPNPHTEECELPRRNMYYHGTCLNCGEEYEGLISIEVRVR